KAAASLTPLAFSRRGAEFVDLNPARVLLRRVSERGVIERLAGLPGDERGVLRHARIVGRGDDELARQGLVAPSKPDLPVDRFLAHRVVLADLIAQGFG